MSPLKSFQQIQLLVAGSLLVLTIGLLQSAEAGQGCPFDDGSCQEYCSQQGCNMGYCGHFAWIQCICRKCGDEWSWYDKVRYNPDKTVNQTELDSLKLNGTTTLILTSGQQQQQASQQQVPKSNSSSSKPAVESKQAAALTTLLIPDLSDTSGKLDLNDIPDENSDKFLDYLAKNHEKLVRATSQQSDSEAGASDDTDDEQVAQSVSTTGPLSQDERDDETIEIQISSSNNNTSNEPSMAATTSTSTTSTTTSSPPAEVAKRATQASDNGQQQLAPLAPGASSSSKQRSPITRLLRMAVIERASEEID